MYSAPVFREALSHLERAVGDAPPDSLRRALIEAHKAYAGRELARMAALCRAAIERFGRQPGTDQLYHLLVWQGRVSWERQLGWF